MKNIFFLSLLLLLPPAVFSRSADVQEDFRRLFMKAQIAFDAQDYGQALKLVDLARKSRKDKIAWELTTLKNSFKPAGVKHAGDSLAAIKTVLKDKQDYDAIAIINAYERFYGTEKFEDSAKKLLGFIETLSPYPEADFMAGHIYRLEGEYDFACRFYTQAYKERAVLDVPDEKYDILYALAETSLTKQDYEQYEKYLLMVIGLGTDYKNETLLSAMIATIKGAKSDCLDKFFTLYRGGNYRLLKAYYELADFYKRAGAKDKTLRTAALCSLTGFSRIYSIVQKRNPEFVFTGLSSLLTEASVYSDIVAWGAENNVWKGFNFLADVCAENGNAVFANQLYSVLQEYSPEEYWKTEAKMKAAALRQTAASLTITTIPAGANSDQL